MGNLPEPRATGCTPAASGGHLHRGRLGGRHIPCEDVHQARNDVGVGNMENKLESRERGNCITPFPFPFRSAGIAHSILVIIVGYADIAACNDNLELTDRAGCPSDVTSPRSMHYNVPLGSQSCSGNLDGKCVA